MSRRNMVLLWPVGPDWEPGAQGSISEDDTVTRYLAMVALLMAIALSGCEETAGPPPGPPPGKGGKMTTATFGSDLEFLQKHTDVVVLGGGTAQVAVVPKYQGRVMTSTAEGADGMSFGWINRKLIASGERQPQINALGGEERMWLGPEGGQFSIFFKPGTKLEDGKFPFKDWQTPECIDWGGWEVVKQDAGSIDFRKEIELVNFSGTRFKLTAERTVRVLTPADIKKHFGVDIPGAVKAVAFESDNRITNTGDAAWTKETGALSIWILCMFNPSPTTTVVIPFVDGPEEELGPIVNDAYFGKVPEDRLLTRDGVIFFKADGKKRGKIGLSPRRAKPILGSYDAANRVLTLANYTRPEGATDYVNSMWEIQKEPFKGDVVNSYNDGPTPAGPPLGPFYELESSSPAAFLKPGETMQHVHRTMHLTGSEGDLQLIAQLTLGVGIDEIKNVFRQSEK